MCTRMEPLFRGTKPRALAVDATITFYTDLAEPVTAQVSSSLDHPRIVIPHETTVTDEEAYIRNHEIPYFTGCDESPLWEDSVTSVDFGIVRVNAYAEAYVDVINPSSRTMRVQLALGDFEWVSSWCTSNPFAQCAEPTVTSECTGSQKNLENVHDDAEYDARFLVSVCALDPVSLSPGARRRIGPIFFMPVAEGIFHTTLFLRNNLTRIAAARVVGRGGDAILWLRHADGECIATSPSRNAPSA